MEGVLLSALGGHENVLSRAHLRMDLSDLDKQTLYLQVNAIEKSTVNSYATGTRDYLHFCIIHVLPLDPTPEKLSHYIAYTSQFIASSPKYLTGVQHLLNDLYPEFDTNHAHPLVKSAIRGSKKVHADPVLQKLPLRMDHQDLGNSRQMPDPKIPKSGHFCPHGFSKILSTPRIRPRFCTKFVCTLDQALIGSVQNFPLCG